VETLAQQQKALFQRAHGPEASSRGPFVSKAALGAALRRYRATLDPGLGGFAPQRKKSILLDDSQMRYVGVFFLKRSALLEPRNPARKDETLIDYEMDSEAEWNEQNGEDLADNKLEEDEDDELEKRLREEGDDDEEAGFIVPDDYLSASEFNLSQSQRSSQVQAEIEEKRKVLASRYTRERGALHLPHYAFFLHADLPEKRAYFEQFRALSLPLGGRLPLLAKPAAPEPPEEERKGEAKAPHPLSLPAAVADLVRLMHGSFESKQKLIDDFL